MEWLVCKACGSSAIMPMDVTLDGQDLDDIEDIELDGFEMMEEEYPEDSDLDGDDAEDHESRFFTCHVCGDNWLSVREDSEDATCHITFIHQMGMALGDGQTQPGLSELLEHIDVTAVDLVLVEGFRHEPFPKIEVYRSGRGQPLLCVGDDTIIAVAADSAPDNPLSIPLLPLNNPEHVAEFVMDWIARSRIRD